jgi:hypothetical protein
MLDAHISEMVVGGEALKHTYFHAAYRLSVICAALLALATFSITGQAMAENGPGTTASDSTVKQVAPAQATLAQPAVIPQPVPVAIVATAPGELPAQTPRVSYNNGQLTIDAQNSILKDVLKAICSQIGAQLYMAPGTGDYRVAAHLSGPARQVISALLYGSNIGYIIVGLQGNAEGVEQVHVRKNIPPSSSAPKLVQEHVAESVPVATEPEVVDVDTNPLPVNPVPQVPPVVQGSAARDALTNPAPAAPTAQPQEGYGCDDVGLVGIPPHCQLPGR